MKRSVWNGKRMDTKWHIAGKGKSITFAWTGFRWNIFSPVSKQSPDMGETFNRQGSHPQSEDSFLMIRTSQRLVKDCCFATEQGYYGKPTAVRRRSKFRDSVVGRVWDSGFGFVFPDPFEKGFLPACEFPWMAGERSVRRSPLTHLSAR